MMAATKAHARRPAKEMPEAPDVSTLDGATLEKRRRRLAARLEDVGDLEREAVEFELQQVEGELDARRRSAERIEAARLGRQEREREEHEHARSAERAVARVELTRLAGEREQAARNIDEAIAALGEAITLWRAVKDAQAVEGRVFGLDAQMIGGERVLGVKLAHDLSVRLPTSGSFRRWDHESREQPFAELDAPFAQLSSLLPEETTP